jgi:hypothetical protein
MTLTITDASFVLHARTIRIISSIRKTERANRAAIKRGNGLISGATTMKLKDIMTPNQRYYQSDIVCAERIGEKVRLIYLGYEEPAVEITGTHEEINNKLRKIILDEYLSRLEDAEQMVEDYRASIREIDPEALA